MQHFHAIHIWHYLTSVATADCFSCGEGDFQCLKSLWVWLVKLGELSLQGYCMDKSKFKNIPIVSIWNLIVLARQRISDSPKQYTKQFSSKIKGKKRRKKQVDQRSKKNLLKLPTHGREYWSCVRMARKRRMASRSRNASRTNITCLFKLSEVMITNITDSYYHLEQRLNEIGLHRPGDLTDFYPGLEQQCMIVTK